MSQWISSGGTVLEPEDIARGIAAGGTVQQLTATTSSSGANQVFRVWRSGGTAVVKIYGSDARERREHHALNALDDLENLPVILDSGADSATHWILFTDAGRWNLQSLPENPGLARAAGEILQELHAHSTAAVTNLTRGIDQEWVSVDFQATLRRVDRYRGRIGLSAELVEAAFDLNAPFASEPVVAHTDPTPRNFVVDDAGKITLISWEWATLAPPEWDLSRALWSVGVHAGPSAAAALVEGYGRSMDLVQLDRWIVYHAAQALVSDVERNLLSRPSSSPSNLVHEFSRAVLGAGTR
ncbi:MAG: aminoglycoside phosphotransferase family protein [Actinomycetia bacterium]|nr:aminoglycoside phosphotransferase family protein [Actinomycetes bacterium]